MTTEKPENGFRENKIFIIEELKGLHAKADANGKMLIKLQVQIATLNVKSGMWGALAGLIPASLAIFYFLTRS